MNIEEATKKIEALEQINESLQKQLEMQDAFVENLLRDNAELVKKNQS